MNNDPLELIYAIAEAAKQVPLEEARRSDLTYTEKRVKGELDRVIVTLEGKNSEQFTKMGKNYKRIKTQIERLEKMQANLNTEAKKAVGDLFEASENVLTRVVDTVSISLTLSKLPEVKDKVTVDHEAIIRELISLQPELIDKINELTEKFTKVSPGTPKPESLRIDIKESVVGDAWGRIKSIAKTFLYKIKSWGDTYDTKLKKIKNKMSELN